MQIFIPLLVESWSPFLQYTRTKMPFQGWPAFLHFFSRGCAQMKRQFLRAACAGTLFAISAFPFCEAAGTKAVTQRNERAAIERELSKSPEFTSAAKGKKVIASTMMTYKEKPNDSATEAEFVESLHYNYDSGKTIRTVLNRTAEKVVKVDLLDAY